ncbi:hypothetical protein [Engelhardtia mirabilis]|uniref:Class III cytochrome C family protein n=1 Tax=Engelhardtia mirabilis TaxID=2528011 RepID=A0A518BEM3_9BACT|nr:Class III cytochrome C family protein [Planctomycetes bacterium Pla133]QDU99771.1 Class III cytochrome C family protein [Planctomycetes bacterium Pla86]
MDPSNTPSSTRRIAHPKAFAGLLVALLVACGLQLRGPDGPRQGWWDERGPVVPHDTFPADCSLCHVGKGWSTIRADFQFDHLAETGVELDGAHDGAQCLRCHNDRGPVQWYAAKGCSGCHQDPHLGRLGATCTECHDTFDWFPSGILADHQSTRFPLEGAHLATACASCHPAAEAGQFTGVSTRCESCHLEDALGAQSFDHVASGNLTSCEQCHQPTQWGGGTFVHNFFPLTGGHALSDCSACHTGGVFSGLSTNCFSCHADDFTGTDDPDHVAAGFSTSCDECHNIQSWEGAAFNHAFFPLTAGHSISDCSACHGSGTFAGLSTDCFSCHASDYAGAMDPNHVTAGFSTACDECHNTSTWEGANVDHSFFPLTAGHNLASCTACHSPGTFMGLSSDCFSCHASDYTGASDPNHVTAGFSTSCEECHNTSDWGDANIDHSFFPLTAGHNLSSCTACHSPGTFTGLSSDCFSCHASDYTGANDPNHIAAGYPTTCQACHNTSDWDDAVFNHDFPIKTGAHKNFSCTQCHTNPATYAVFSCIDCHEHNAVDTQKKHKPDEVPGYSYNSAACYSCHPNGKGD